MDIIEAQELKRTEIELLKKSSTKNISLALKTSGQIFMNFG